MARSADQRLDERHSFRAAVTLCYRTIDGTDKRLPGTARNIADRGIQVDVTEPLEAGTRIQLEGDYFEPAAAACVRYCRRAGDGWRVGVALERSLVWSKLRTPRESEPERIAFDRFGKPVQPRS
jgi:hypothetical protein